MSCSVDRPSDWLQFVRSIDRSSERLIDRSIDWLIVWSIDWLMCWFNDLSPDLIMYVFVHFVDTCMPTYFFLLIQLLVDACRRCVLSFMICYIICFDRLNLDFAKGTMTFSWLSQIQPRYPALQAALNNLRQDFQVSCVATYLENLAVRTNR